MSYVAVLHAARAKIAPGLIQATGTDPMTIVVVGVLVLAAVVVWFGSRSG